MYVRELKEYVRWKLKLHKTENFPTIKITIIFINKYPSHRKSCSVHPSVMQI